MAIEQLRGSYPHQVRRLDSDVGGRNRELNTLVLTDRPTEHDTFGGIASASIDEPAAIAHAFGGDENPFGIESIEDIREPLAFLAHQVLGRHLQILDEELGGSVIHHGANGTNRDTVPDRLPQVDEQDGQSIAA